jgi:outer membrane protein OmpA-like peptidoglycan-associated protein
VLLALTAACGGGQATNGGTGPAVASKSADPPSAGPAEERAAARAPPIAAQPAPAEKTADQLAQELRDGADALRDRSEARAALARYGSVAVEHNGMIVTIPGDTLFAAEQAALLASARPRMEGIASALLVTRDRDLIVESHADTGGPAELAVDLTRARAEAVQAFLVAQGYPAERIRAKGLGQDRPVASNASAGGRAQNRRLKILISFARDVPLPGGAR